MAVRLRD